jgi:DivIVA domain-containing protein
MELDRGNIEKRDFATARRGYDQAEVDRHLRAVAEAVESLKATPTQSTVAGVAAEQVEAIVAAAEASAREIEQRAHVAAAEHTRRAAEVADQLAARAEEIQQQMTAVVAQIDGLKAAIAAMTADLGEARFEPEPAPVAVPEPEPAPLQVVPDPEPEPAAEPAAKAKAVEPEPEPQPPVTREAAPEGARLIALNMALSGTPREETARYLRENFELDDADGLLDDVYARAGA